MTAMPTYKHQHAPGTTQHHGKVVRPCGPPDATVLLLGERPGFYEAEQGRPFVGPTGREQQWYLGRHGLRADDCRMANVCWDYNDTNDDPKPSDIARWEAETLKETQHGTLKLVVAVGRYAMRWLLGESAELDVSRGMVHRAGAFESAADAVTKRLRGTVPCAQRVPPGCLVIPVTHPAAGLHNAEKKAEILQDYDAVADVWKRVRAGREVRVREDAHAGSEQYHDVTGHELASALSGTRDDVIALDTEGDDKAPWSVQVSWREGTAHCLRTSQPDFDVGIRALQRAADRGVLFITHAASTPRGCMWDLRVCRAMGLELRRARLWDTMFGAYLLRLEPRGLKALSYRWCGMGMEDYEKLIGDVARGKQIDYLCELIQRQWPKPEQRLVFSNDGTSRIYTPKPISTVVNKLLIDVFNPPKATADDDGEVDIAARWKGFDKVQRQMVEQEMGKLPTATLDDVPLDKAVWYASRDADATLRLYRALSDEHTKLELSTVMTQSMDALPVFEEMEASGIPASPMKLEELATELTKSMDKLGARMSVRYYNGKPFNPKSTRQVTSVMIARGLESAKRTERGAMSTGKKGIEHLRYKDAAIADIVEWREKQHIRDMYCVPMLELLGDTRDQPITVHTRLNPFGTTTRRLASNDPNLLAFPKHEKPDPNKTGESHDYGQRVRDCFIAPPGMTFLECDLSQIEVRMLAHESADPVLIDLFHAIDPATGKPRDVHLETAARVFGVAPSDVTKVQRFLAKRVTFGIAYGVSGMGLADQLRVAGIEGWDAKKCDKAITEWLKLYKGCAAYFKEVERSVTKLGVVRDCWGMPRYLPAVWSTDEKMAAEAKRQAVNHRIQGGSQGLLQQSIGWLRRRVWELQDGGMNVQWALTIHDSLLFLVDEEIVDPVTELVIEGMTRHNGMKLRVPVLADAKTGTTWGQL